ncbi:hypothetical protein GGI25_002864 [Coemansia spiralis]|uniref:Uncharacterized protein n=2 Tax=Coemansia TaxID=4863 RepID=A0A9W8G7Q6_9FUNG|nr:hypothetical protein EDC05_002836 [Coemansia umbellata]KAJ2622280.1 hypothetical protein GGI26_003433 [Coemansia sp. RSA 1358]KAJ2677766.1 hypothetical protein GGI25_002864 [Coemansia spiralis]
MTPRRSAEMQQQADWEAREADRKHREQARERKLKKKIEADIWIPRRFRVSRRNTDSSVESSASDSLHPTTIRWADSV